MPFRMTIATILSRTLIQPGSGRRKSGRREAGAGVGSSQ